MNLTIPKVISIETHIYRLTYLEQINTSYVEHDERTGKLKLIYSGNNTFPQDTYGKVGSIFVSQNKNMYRRNKQVLYIRCEKYDTSEEIEFER